MVPRDEAEHSFVLVRVIIHVNHDRRVTLCRLVARDEPIALAPKERLRVCKLQIVEYPDGDQPGFLLAMCREHALLVENLLVPCLFGGHAVGHARHEHRAPRGGTDVHASDIDREHLSVEAAAAPSHRLVVDAAEFPVRPLPAEPVRLPLDVGISVQVFERVGHVHQVQVRDEHAGACRYELPQQVVLKGAHLVRGVRTLLCVGYFQVRPESGHIRPVLRHVRLGLVVQHRQDEVPHAQPAPGDFEEGLKDISPVPPAYLCVLADHHPVRQAEHHLPSILTARL
mmetsp:Transcript_11562/g.49835  ORF Transcript_11562/g.49835 Transcript_11562/m.49835 type:complete len:284 (-) Transcript_11562:289-1140(-)